MQDKTFHTIRNILLLSVCAISFLALIGWIADIPSLYTVGPTYISMKAQTAVGLLLAGLSSFFLTNRKNSETLVMVLSCALELLVLYAFIFSKALKVGDNIPSTVALVNLGLLGLTNIFIILHSKWYKISATMVAGAGVFGLLGYFIGEPAMYSYIKNIDTGMSIQTCVSFLFLGMVGLLTKRVTVHI